MTSYAHARWLTPQEAPAEYITVKRSLIVKNFISEEILEYKIKILNESGRQAFGTFSNTINKNVEKIEILEAKTIVGKTEYKVPKSNIETKPLASQPLGFDELVQTNIVFPNVTPGCILSIKYKIKTLKQPFANYFSKSFYGGTDMPIKDLDIRIKSDIPLHFVINDPDKVINVDQSSREGIYSYRMHLKPKKILFKALANEHENVYQVDDLVPYVIFSNLKSYEELAKLSYTLFEPTINEKLPPQLMQIAKTAQTLSNLTNQLNFITSQLAHQIRYLSDRTTIEGRYTPRSLTNLVKSALGDCKDFSSATVAILKSLGYNAKVALVSRGKVYKVPKHMIPCVEFINHAIVKVTDKDGRIFWIDPTNPVSMAGGIFPDIANRPAIVLDDINPSYEMIPEIDPTTSKTRIAYEIVVNASNKNVSGIITKSGESCLELAGWSLYASEQTIKEILIRNLSDEISPNNTIIKLPDLSARIVLPELNIDFSYSQENSLQLTNVGLGIDISSQWGIPLYQISKDQQGDLFLGEPSSIEKIIRVKNITAGNLAQLAFLIDTPWIHLSRTCHIENGDTVIISKLIIYKRFVTALETKTSEFIRLKKIIGQYVTNVSLILPRE